MLISVKPSSSEIQHTLLRIFFLCWSITLISILSSKRKTLECYSRCSEHSTPYVFQASMMNTAFFPSQSLLRLHGEWHPATLLTGLPFGSLSGIKAHVMSFNPQIQNQRVLVNYSESDSLPSAIGTLPLT